MGTDSEDLVDLSLLHVRPADLPNVWPVLEPMLLRACEETQGEITVQAVLANLEHWPILAIANGGEPMAVMVVCVSERADGKRTLDCLVASGEKGSWWPRVDDQFDAFARGLGCSRVRAPKARKGWVRALSHWKMAGYVLEREI